MSKNFAAIWKKRKSNSPQDQANLYLELRHIFDTSPRIRGLNIKDRDDFFQEFYLNKIFYPLSTGMAISTPNYDEMPSGQLINMIKQYGISCYRKRLIRIFSDSDNTESSEEVVLADPWADLEEDFSSQAMKEAAVTFIYASEDWVFLLLLKSARGDRFSGNDFPRRAKLGLVLKKSFHTGASSITEYHQKTMIGQWLIVKYKEDILPLSEDFLLTVLKNLHQAALYISKEDNQP